MSISHDAFRVGVLSLLVVLSGGSSAFAQERGTSLLFVATDVPDAELLATRARADQEVVRLQDGVDALDQIGRALATRSDVRAISIVSHGAPGALQLGSTRIDQPELVRRAADVRAWRDSLVPGADILLYGCDVGASSAGGAFVSTLSSLTGADVAASTDATGGTDEGDWMLERRVGHVTARAPWSRAVMAQWRHQLTTYTEGADLSNTIGGATTIVLQVGGNTVSGTVTTPTDGQDNFLVQVPVGTSLTGVSLTLNTGSGFNGSVTFNLNENRTTSGAFTVGLPLGPGSYYVQVIANFSVGNAWSMSFTVASSAACGDGIVQAGEACDDGNTQQCDGCSNTCTSVINGCFIGGACVAEGTVNPANQCQICARATQRNAYSPRPAGTVCDDGLFCTTGETCNGGSACVGTARNCTDGLACTTDACDETGDRCTNTLSSGCLIGGVCVATGVLDPANQCRACLPAASTTMYSASPAGTACSDGQFCTVGDACNGAGGCAGGPRDCSDGLSCTTDLCDDAADVCVRPLASGCLIGGACIPDGAPDPSNSCMVCRPSSSTTAYSPASAGTTCNDGQFCTISDVCNGSGGCGGSARDCSDTLSCTTDSCDEAADTCNHPLATGCLIGGACVTGGAADPANACMVCTPATSTSAYSPASSGTSCDDGQFCTTVDACNGSGTCGGAARDCSDTLSCTTDSCDEAADTCNHPLASGCLIGGACVADGTADSTNACRVCAPATSTSAYSPASSGTSCDDGQFCTTSDACDGAGVCGGAARVCDDGMACTTDACDESTDACTTAPIASCGDAGVDAAIEVDASTGTDSGVLTDAGGTGVDAGTSSDAGRRDGAVADGSAGADGSVVDSGVAPPMVSNGGCGCRVGPAPRTSTTLFAVLLAFVGLWRVGARRRRGAA